MVKEGQLYVGKGGKLFRVLRETERKGFWVVEREDGTLEEKWVDEFQLCYKIKG